jgi:hypothetical protein
MTHSLKHLSIVSMSGLGRLVDPLIELHRYFYISALGSNFGVSPEVESRTYTRSKNEIK